MLLSTNLQAQIMEVEGDIDIHGAKIFQLGDPEAPHDAANKAYVDNVVINYLRSLPNDIQVLLDAGEKPLKILAAGASK